MNKFWIITSCVGSLVVPALAHHSFAAEYDATKPVTMMGTVTKVEWVNPHCHIFVDVKNDSGQVTNWTIELANPNELLHDGLTRNTLKPGDVVTMKALLAKDGSNLADARTLDLPDGRKISFEGGGQYSVRPKK